MNFKYGDKDVCYMSIEIEVKAYANNLSDIEKRLRKHNAHYVGSFVEIDKYFNSPVHDFAESDEALRIRRTNKGTFITYKGPKIDTNSKTREEVEIEIFDGNSMEKLIKKLGFVHVDTVKKIRRKYIYRKFEISLDNVRNLGDFVEVETRGKNIQKCRNSIIRFLASMGLNRYERRSYLELLLSRKLKNL
jgi:adenylate cyclase class 2